MDILQIVKAAFLPQACPAATGKDENKLDIA